MDFKHILYAALSAILPIIYTLIVGKLPDFPLDSASFVGLFLWIVGLLIGGWNLAMSRVKYLERRKTSIGRKK